MKITLKRLRYKATFNQRTGTEADNGNWIYKDVKLFEFYYGYYKQSLSQSVSSNAFDYLKDKVTIIARHNDKFIEAFNNDSYTISLPSPNNKTYKIVSINPDYEVNGYDTIVLSAVGATTTNSTGE
jgi:hypothetical protein